MAEKYWSKDALKPLYYAYLICFPYLVPTHILLSNSDIFYNALNAINYCPVEYVEQSVSSVSLKLFVGGKYTYAAILNNYFMPFNNHAKFYSATVSAH